MTDDVLDELGVDWDTLRKKLDKWIQDNPEHTQYGDAKKFRDEGWNRKDSQLKNLRNIIVGVSGSTKPWEIAVGRAISKLPEKRFRSEHSLVDKI